VRNSIRSGPHGRILNSENPACWTDRMKSFLGKGFLLIFIAGAILVALIATETGATPGFLRILRILLGILFILLAPGFALQAALFPHPGDLDGVARAAFSFGLSIAANPFILIVLAALNLGTQFVPIAVSHLLILLVCAAVTWLRSRRMPAENAKIGNLRTVIMDWWASQDRFSRGAYLFLGFAFLVTFISGAIVAQEAPAEPFTEFYLLDAQGLAMEYPRAIVAGTPVECLLGIRNQEGRPSQYRIVAVGSDQQALATAGPIMLEDGQSWRGGMTILLEQAGNGQKVEFLLERIGSPWPYRTLRIWMNVDPPGAETPTITSGSIPPWNARTGRVLVFSHSWPERRMQPGEWTG
jgi:uncharacterized membrane protein